MAENFKLPGSSYEELIKIIKAYSTSKNNQKFSLEMLSQSTGIDTTTISRNNGFLIQIGLITSGNSKSTTELGNNLGRAYALNINEEIIKTWNIIIDGNEFLGRMLSAIKIRGGMDKSNLVSHILYSSGSTPTNNTKAGANTIIDIFKIAGLVNDEDGKIKLVDNKTDDTYIHKIDNTINLIKPEPNKANNNESKNHSQNINVNINININATGENLEGIQEQIKNLINSLKE